MDTSSVQGLATSKPSSLGGRASDNARLFGLDVHRWVFPLSLLLILSFSAYAMSDPAAAGAALNKVKNWTISKYDWFYLFAGNVFVVFCLGLALSPLGRVRIGGASAHSDFGRLSYVSMLFAAGVGIGLMFWGVAEPVAYYTDWYKTPLGVDKLTPEAAHAAMGATMFHWGLHPWAMYCITALVIGFFAYNRGLPNSMRSGLQPLIGKAYAGWTGHIVDIFTVVLTTFGLATSLGLGALQATAGLHHVFGTPNTFGMQVGFIVFVASVAAFSAAAGMNKGVKLLSNINMGLALVLMVFVIIGAGVVSFLAGLGSTTVDYAVYFLPLSNWIGREDTEWFHGWTVFYWAWWASWAPFVGMFIARISRGRTVREIIISVMLVPTLVTVLWMTAFGGTAVTQAAAGTGELAGGIKDVTLTLFQFLETLPLAQFTSILAVLLLGIFMVTSIDSGCLVADTLASGGRENTPALQKVLWAAILALVCLTLFIVGGDGALKAAQAGTIALGLPFMALMFVLMLGLTKALWEEKGRTGN